MNVVDMKRQEVAACGNVMQVLNALPGHVKVVDLSADFRLRDVASYAAWYGGKHLAPQLQLKAVYGLTELHRTAVSGACLVANPGCYPTSVQLPLVPLLKAGAISSKNIIIDAKSGVSGAGRAAKEANLFCEVADGMHAYGVGSHRHMPEIEQGLSDAVGGEAVTVSFTPHLIPMSRGMQSTIYVEMCDGQTVDSLHDILAAAYADEYFVRCGSSMSILQQQLCISPHFACTSVRCLVPCPHSLFLSLSGDCICCGFLVQALASDPCGQCAACPSCVRGSL
jgi:N-acetyl-gamma-glutamyl-phosphate reductase